MNQNAALLIRFRLRNEWRQVLQGGSHLSRLKLGIQAIIALSFPFSMWQIYSLSLHQIKVFHNATPVFYLGTLISGFLIYMFFLSEMLREMIFADHMLVNISPFGSAPIIKYRVMMVLLALLPFSPGIALFSPYVAWNYSTGVLRRIALLIFIFSFFIWLCIAALWTATLIRSLTRQRPDLQRWVAIATHLAIVLMSSALFYLLMDFNGLKIVAARLDFPPLAGLTILALATFLLLTGHLLLRHTNTLWTTTAMISDAPKRHARIISEKSRLFSKNLSRAIFQKDMKDLFRNPAYRALVLCTLLLLPMVLFGQWKSGTAAPPSERRTRAVLFLPYFIPLVVSTRTAILERSMLDFYRLVLPEPGIILRLKWQVQTVVNCLLTALLALPYFLLLKKGPTLFESLYFAGIVMVYVPIWTMLAIALGKLLPSSGETGNPLGASGWACLIYLLLAAFLYSLLLNHMVLGSVLYSLFLIGLASTLFHFAQKSLHGNGILS